jgi:hypothetical protein
MALKRLDLLIGDSKPYYTIEGLEMAIFMRWSAGMLDL